MAMNVRKHIKRLTALSLTVAAAAILWLALSANGDATTAQAQTADTPTPVPTVVPTPERPGASGNQNLPPIEGRINPPQYPNMDSNLNRIVHQAEVGGFTVQALTAAAGSSPIHREQSVAVTL